MILKSFLSALKMYSRIPCPAVEWCPENRRYSLCFFPAVGVVIGIIFVLWQRLCVYFEVLPVLQGAVMMLIPLAVTGGFHMDGFCDVADARSSCAQTEKKLEILKDPHIGSFALIHAAAYLILQTALYASLSSLRIVLCTACGFVLSRALSGLCAMLLPAAKKEGSLQSFVLPADRKRTIAVLSAVCAAAAVLMLLFSPAAGAFCIAAASLCTAHYRNVCLREFGGITGDCAGWFVQNAELCTALAAAAVQILF